MDADPAAPNESDRGAALPVWLHLCLGAVGVVALVFALLSSQAP